MSVTPVRTCVGCGQRTPQSALLRIVGGRDGLRPDPTRRLPGRGGYLHADPACWARFVQRRGPVRSLRLTPARADRERLVAALQGASQ
ncbi:MAG TPA: YlxR family protein [Candidatus Binatus sp.]|nr:YlxR family protein [Candidatus Binatus sp.]